MCRFDCCWWRKTIFSEAWNLVLPGWFYLVIDLHGPLLLQGHLRANSTHKSFCFPVCWSARCFSGSCYVITIDCPSAHHNYQGVLAKLEKQVVKYNDHQRMISIIMIICIQRDSFNCPRISSDSESSNHGRDYSCSNSLSSASTNHLDSCCRWKMYPTLPYSLYSLAD